VKVLGDAGGGRHDRRLRIWKPATPHRTKSRGNNRSRNGITLVPRPGSTALLLAMRPR
jgi:hypothetical protein